LTNEELALLVQAGGREHEAQLWAQVERFVEFRARYFANCLHGGAADFEDLKQSGFFAMLEATRYYSPAKGYSFLSYLKWTLKKSFAVVAGTSGTKRDASLFAHSLDAPAMNIDGCDSGIAFICDEQSLDLFEVAEAQQFTHKVRAALLESMRALSERKQNVLILHYYGEMPFAEIAKIVGHGSAANVESAHYAALRYLRVFHGATLRELLRGYDEFDIVTAATDTKHFSTERAAFALAEWRRINGL